MSNQTFYTFIDAKNKAARILLAHFLAVQRIMGPILHREAIISNTGIRDTEVRVGGEGRAHKEWVEGIWNQLTEDNAGDYEKFMEWPRSIFQSENLENW